MLLITMNEWLGPGRRMTEEKKDKINILERHMSFATRMNLGDAIEQIYKYQEAYNKHYLLSVEYRLLSVIEIDELSNQQLSMCEVDIVEDLKTRPEDFV